MEAFPWGIYFVPVCDAREHGKTLEAAIREAQVELLSAMNCKASPQTVHNANMEIGNLLKDKR